MESVTTTTRDARNSSSRNDPIKISILNEAGNYYKGEFHPTTSLWNVLTLLEQKYGENLTNVYGVPDTEETSILRVQYNVKGYMQPVLETFHDQKKCESNGDLKATTLQALQLTSGPLKLCLSYKYQAPELDEQTAKAMMEKLKQQLLGTPESQEESKDLDPTASKLKKEADNKAHNNLTLTVSERRSLLPPHRFRKLIGLRKSNASPVGTKGENARAHAARAHVATTLVDKESSASDGGGHDTETKEYDIGAGDFHSLVKAVRGERQQSSKMFTQFKTTSIRFRLPGRLTLEAKFQPEESISEVTAFVKSCLRDPGLPFTLFTTPPKRVLGDKDASKSLASLGLVPSAIIHMTSASLDFASGKPLKSIQSKASVEHEAQGWYLAEPIIAET